MWHESPEYSISFSVAVNDSDTFRLKNPITPVQHLNVGIFFAFEQNLLIEWIWNFEEKKVLGAYIPIHLDCVLVDGFSSFKIKTKTLLVSSLMGETCPNIKYTV